MTALWLAGATQGRAAGLRDRDHGPLYSRAVLARWVPGSAPEVVASYVSPRSVTDGRPVGHAFKGLHRDGDRWLLCTERELLWFDDAGNQVERLDHPWFNDLHHAVRFRGQLAVASTGLDGVLRPETDSWFGPDFPRRDWRCVDRRPHAVHPNHLFVWNDVLWCTRFHDGTAREVGGSRELHSGSTRIHDGLPHAGRVWFTRVDGTLLGVNGCDRVELTGQSGTASWCRGLARWDGLWAVGFTRLRATRWRHNLAWAKGMLRGDVRVGSSPTRVVLTDGRQVQLSQTLESAGIDALFGIVPGP